jgi:hypothetical protein
MVIRSCQAVPVESAFPRSHFMPDDAWQSIKKRPRGGDDTSAWYRIFETLFPGLAPPATPYSNDIFTEKEHLIEKLFECAGDSAETLYQNLRQSELSHDEAASFRGAFNLFLLRKNQNHSGETKDASSNSMDSVRPLPLINAQAPSSPEQSSRQASVTNRKDGADNPLNTSQTDRLIRILESNFGLFPTIARANPTATRRIISKEPELMLLAAENHATELERLFSTTKDSDVPETVITSKGLHSHEHDPSGYSSSSLQAYPMAQTSTSADEEIADLTFADFDRGRRESS